MLSFSLSTRQLLEQILTCSIPQRWKSYNRQHGPWGRQQTQCRGVYHTYPERMRRRLRGLGERTRWGRGFSLFKPWERVGYKSNQKCPLRRSKMATGRLWSPAFPDRRGSSRTEMVAVQEKPLAEERTLLKNTAAWFFLTLKIGGRGGLS